MRSLLGRLALLWACLFTAVGTAVALPDSLDVADSTGSFETVFHIGHFDFDCVPDTLIGFVVAPSFQVLPRRIHWGHDTALYCGTSSIHTDVTYFVYPDWEEISGGLTVIQYNQQDSLADILFFYGGKIDTGTSRRDTAVSIAIFGQDQIGEIDSIPLTLTDTLQESPFVALELLRHSRLLDSLHVDYTGYPSYELPVVSLDLTGDTTLPTIVLLSSVHDTYQERKLLSEVYPNPAAATTTIRVRPLPPGKYLIEALAGDGDRAFQQEILVGASEELFAPLDFSALPSGYYQIIVRSEHHILSTHSVAVVR